jgi:hypothetical protein
LRSASDTRKPLPRVKPRADEAVRNAWLMGAGMCDLPP